MRLFQVQYLHEDGTWKPARLLAMAGGMLMVCDDLCYAMFDTELTALSCIEVLRLQQQDRVEGPFEYRIQPVMVEPVSE